MGHPIKYSHDFCNILVQYSIYIRTFHIDPRELCRMHPGDLNTIDYYYCGNIWGGNNYSPLDLNRINAVLPDSMRVYLQQTIHLYSGVPHLPSGLKLREISGRGIHWYHLQI